MTFDKPNARDNDLAGDGAASARHAPGRDEHFDRQQHVVPVGALGGGAASAPAVRELLDAAIVGRSAPARSLKGMVALAAECRATVLVTGESGTGKELVARTVHELGERSAGPFVAVNCAALPEALLESELFGYERGAFTGALARRDGLFVAAHRGTIFLDEVGETTPSVQSKLLRVLQERRVRPVGSHSEQAFDARVILATNRDLEHEVKEGRFREDLYYRVNVLPIHLPPLRERRADIPELIDRFLSGRGIEPRAVMLLCQHHWPGNVRELQNVLERLCIMAGRGGAVTAELVGRTLPFTRSEMTVASAAAALISAGGVKAKGDQRRPARSLLAAALTGEGADRVKREMIEAALLMSGGNQSRAAELLGMKRAAFHRLRKRVIARTASSAATAASQPPSRSSAERTGRARGLR